ncbi:MAG: helix-turn-helix domain-containing protein, partial [Candidatus Adiutrix sp.]
MEQNGGRYGAGFIRAEMDIDPKAWFLTSHFVGDEVMPGTLMYEGCLHTLRTFLLTLGWVAQAQTHHWQPVVGLAASLKCRGQVTKNTKTVAYEIHIRRLDFLPNTQGDAPQPFAVAEAIMLADNRPIVEVKNMNVRLSGPANFPLQENPSHPLGQKLSVKAPPAKDGGLIFDKSKLLALATGRPSEALGAPYARFDHGEFVARLPRPPYDLVDEVKIITGRPYETIIGSEVLATVTIPADSWLFKEAGGREPSLPYAALNEVALQPCGFLAAFMGSALPFDFPMYFRNLGGEAIVYGHVFPNMVIETTARLTKTSRMGEMIIQHYKFSCVCAGQKLYEGTTHFGFFSASNLARQSGLTGPNLPHFPRVNPHDFSPYPQGEPWPSNRLRMVDEIYLNPKGGASASGMALAKTKVNPAAWFFEAHFYQDPVWPGSLGLEAFLQVAKVVAKQRFCPGAIDNQIKWLAPALGSKHSWAYRGQITNNKKEMTIALEVKSIDEARKLIEVSGVLSVDNLPIYEMTNFWLGLDLGEKKPTHLFSFVDNQAGVSPENHHITPQTILAWRKKKGLSQGQLAQLMGVTPIYVSLMERGKRNISPPMAEKLALIFSDDSPVLGTSFPVDGKILPKGTLKNRRKDNEMAASILTSEQLRKMRL